MKSLAPVLVPVLLGGAAALSFAAPFDTKGDFKLSGDAVVSGSAVQLAQRPRQQGAVWLTTPITDDEWTLEATLRSTADTSTDVGASGFTLWYTTKPNSAGPVHGGADKWDGLAVMMDSLGKSQSVRGHLSDGTYSFGGTVEDAALSLCRIDYRNAAVPITLRVGYSQEGFVVDINGNKCFLTTEITLPSGYFGVSANSDLSGDVLSVERLEVFPVMKPDIAAHLPQHAGENAAAASGPSGRAEAAADKADKASAKAVDKAGVQAGAQAAAPAVDAAALQAAVGPVMTRLEFVDQKLARLESVVNQLVDTLTISLAQVSGDRSAATEGDPALHKELRDIRSQILELRKATTQQAPAPALASSGPNLWLVVFVVMAAQFMAVLVYNALSKRRRRHEKLI